MLEFFDSTTIYNASLADQYFAWIEKSPVDQADVFKYVMFSQVNAFDPQQQQDVLNAFYGQLKPPQFGALDPYDRNDCNAYRPRRWHDPRDGTHCLASKNITLHGIGR